ncbi:hypothetical protein F4803DRAFT_568368 [Xylaria telfairii]|nr:hypothetical protein F4803DRAFT_568368 [Xylaria telfairii]
MSATPVTYFNQPPELLLMILSDMDHTSRLQAAIAYPEVFLRPGFNIYVQDAADQARRQRLHPDPTEPLITHRNAWPLLYTAIENKMDISVIESLLRVYIDYCATSIDGIWGQALTNVPTPLMWATMQGNLQVVSLLLDWGADPLLLRGPRGYTAGHVVDCSLSNFIHAQCQPLDEGTQITGSSCITALGAALLQGIDIGSRDSHHQGVEECALLLYTIGLPIPSGGNMLAALATQLYFPVRAGFLSLVEALIDSVAPQQRGRSTFRNSIYYGLTCAVNFQKNDDFRSIIDYLLSVGAPLVREPVNRIHANTHAHVAYGLGHLRTATLFLEKYFAHGRIRLNYSAFKLYNSPDLMPFVRALYRAMGAGGSVDGPVGTIQLAANQLHQSLLAWATADGQEEAVEWLVDQGAGSLINVLFAIVMNNNESLSILVRSGVIINGIGTVSYEIGSKFGLHGGPGRVWNTDPESPLNLALRLQRWEMACFLIQFGADPTLVTDDVKQTLIGEYHTQYGMTYADAKQTLVQQTQQQGQGAPNWLRTEYYSTFDDDRKLFMFHYVLR